MAEFNGIRWAYDRYELIADGIVHGVGLVLALIGATVLIFYATVWSSYGALAAAWIYGVGLVLTLAISFSYNIWPVSRTKWFLRRFDHSAIFILIAATYTPFLERGADDPLLSFMLVAIWLFAAGGIVLKCAFPGVTTVSPSCFTSRWAGAACWWPGRSPRAFLRPRCC